MGFLKDKQTETHNGLLQGYFGYSSLYKKDVAVVIPDRMENTIFINIFSTILALGITIPLGIYCAVHKNGVIDKITQVITINELTAPLIFLHTLKVEAHI